MSVSLGPFGFSVTHLIFFAACAIALVLGALLGKKRKLPISDAVFRVLAVTLIVARLSFVIRYFDLYISSPWQILNVRDGGFDFWIGIAAGTVMLIWEVLRRRPLLIPLAVASFTGLFVYLGLDYYHQQYQAVPRLPAITVQSLAGDPVDLQAEYRGQGLVINLWATWCPPCVREMPLLEDAQQRWTDVTIVTVNQGESAAAVRQFFSEQNIKLDHVLLDTNSTFSNTIESYVLPTTLFFDENGLLVDSHIGEFSSARLYQGVQRIRAARE